jgi:hypothetical protein
MTERPWSQSKTTHNAMPARSPTGHRAITDTLKVQIIIGLPGRGKVRDKFG